jgi:hypothetical protein
VDVQSSMPELMSHASLNQFIMDLAKDPSNAHNYMFNPAEALAGAAGDFPGLSQALPADATRAKRSFPLDDAGLPPLPPSFPDGVTRSSFRGS